MKKSLLLAVLMAAAIVSCKKQDNSSQYLCRLTVTNSRETTLRIDTVSAPDVSAYLKANNYTTDTSQVEALCNPL